ncbi:MAG: ABC transporter permease [Clostridiales bacterium]|jgi:peptide/nickel transport system permease protein|nr:ABC transporter permease [Clostridiales bacterium]
MLSYLLKRLFHVVTTLLVLSLIIFAVLHLTPGDPARIMLGPEAPEETVEALRVKLGVKDPLPLQYIRWVGNALRGDLGDSYFRNESVASAVGKHLGATIALSVWSQLLAILVAVPAGVYAAKNKGGKVDAAVAAGTLAGISVPSFLFSLILILIFGVWLKWLPASGYKTLSQGIGLHFRYIALPVISLAFMQASLIARITRSTVADVTSAEYIKTALAKGVPGTSIMFKHALRNAFNPILTTIGQTFGLLLSGASVVETVFNIPGLGQLMVSSILKRDYPVIQGLVLITSLVYVAVNLVVDLLYGVVDPRVRVIGENA